MKKLQILLGVILVILSIALIAVPLVMVVGNKHSDLGLDALTNALAAGWVLLIIAAALGGAGFAAGISITLAGMRSLKR
jgi:hypothetical protein